MKKVFLALMFLLMGKLYAQDPTYSLFYGNPLYLNSAYAGADPGWDLVISHRSQWPEVSKASSFLNTTIAFDMRSYPFRNKNRNTIANSTPLGGKVSEDDMRLLNLNGLGLGFIVNDNLEGSGRLRNTDIGLVLAKPLYITRKTFFSFSSQIKVGNRRIDWNRLIFTGQLDPIFGVVRNQQELEGFPDVFYNSFYWDMGFGGLFRQDFGEFASYTAGISFNNVLRSGDDLVADGFAKLHSQLTSSRFTIHNSFSFKPNKNFAFVPTFIYEYQKPLTTFSLGSYIFNGLNYDMVNSSQNLYYSLFYGAFYRFNSYPTNYDVLNNHDAIIGFIGLKRTYIKNRLLKPRGRSRTKQVGMFAGMLSTLTMSFSYDYTVSKLGMVSENPTPTGGTFEIHIGLGGNNQSSDCFRLGSKNNLSIIEPY